MVASTWLRSDLTFQRACARLPKKGKKVSCRPVQSQKRAPRAAVAPIPFRAQTLYDGEARQRRRGASGAEHNPMTLFANQPDSDRQGHEPEP